MSLKLNESHADVLLLTSACIHPTEASNTSVCGRSPKTGQNYPSTNNIIYQRCLSE